MQRHLHHGPLDSAHSVCDRILFRRCLALATSATSPVPSNGIDPGSGTAAELLWVMVRVGLSGAPDVYTPGEVNGPLQAPRLIENAMPPKSS